MYPVLTDISLVCGIKIDIYILSSTYPQFCTPTYINTDINIYTKERGNTKHPIQNFNLPLHHKRPTRRHLHHLPEINRPLHKRHQSNCGIHKRPPRRRRPGQLNHPTPPQPLHLPPTLPQPRRRNRPLQTRPRSKHSPLDPTGRMERSGREMVGPRIHHHHNRSGQHGGGQEPETQTGGSEGVVDVPYAAGGVYTCE